MKLRLNELASERLTGSALDEPLTDNEILRVLSRVARAGKLADRLRAAELIARLKLRADGTTDEARLSDEERAKRIEAILERARARRTTREAEK